MIGNVCVFLDLLRRRIWYSRRITTPRVSVRLALVFQPKTHDEANELKWCGRKPPSIDEQLLQFIAGFNHNRSNVSKPLLNERNTSDN